MELKGTECFTYNGHEINMTIQDFWKWHFSEIYDLQDKIAEFIVATALGLDEPYNVGSWTLYDIDYHGVRIEVKETSYYHAWQTDEEPKSQLRTFGITKAYSEYQDNTSEFKRQNDIYVFCLNIGETRETSNPMKLENWEFYIVPTSTINECCGDAKSISLNRLKKLTNPVAYDELRSEIDELISVNNLG